MGDKNEKDDDDDDKKDHEKHVEHKDRELDEPEVRKVKHNPKTTAEKAEVVVPVKPPFVFPALYVTKHALAEMTMEVLEHSDIETAWGLYGFRYPKAIFVVGVIRPVLGEAVRGYANAEAGGQEMANAMRWLHANHRLITSKVTPKVDQGVFCFLYKGHSHHTLGFDQYSGTDQSSIYQAVSKDGMEVAVGPLALIRKNDSSYLNGSRWNQEVYASRNSKVAFKFYLLTKEMIEYGYTQAEIVRPTLVDTVDTLLVPPMGWEFARDDDFKEQLRHMNSFGYGVTVTHRDTNGKPPLEIQFTIDSDTFKCALVITTDWNYPEVAPRIQLLPKNGSMTFAQANEFSSKTWWKKGDDFIDIIGRMRQGGCL